MSRTPDSPDKTDCPAFFMDGNESHIRQDPSYEILTFYCLGVGLFGCFSADMVRYNHIVARPVS